jgi:putative lipoprotein
MTSSRTLLFALLPLFAGCQSLPWSTEPSRQATERLQGEITRNDGTLMLRTCQGQRQVTLLDDADTGLPDDVMMLMTEGGAPLFGDVRGRLSTRGDGSGELQLTDVYRLQSEGQGCNTRGFKELTLRATGHEPGWNVRITSSGMLLERQGQDPLAVPYLEEQLPGGQTSFSSEANSQRLDLWVAPQRCVDGATGAVSHLTAELRVDEQTLRGCAYYGGARGE